MTTAIQKHTQLATLVKSPAINQRFSEVLGKRAPQFMSSLLQVGNSLGPDCEPMTIISGAMVAASLDLPINKNLGFAWLVPFKERGEKKAQFQMGYKGYIQLALRTGQYKRMNAGPINIECVGGFDAVGERRLDFSQYDPEKPAAGYFFAFEMVNGFTKVAYWSKKDVEAHAKQYSQSYRGGYSSPWKTHFDEMATKTVIANELRQWGILSVEMQQAMAVDQGVIRGMDANEVAFPDAPIVEVDTTAEAPQTKPEQPMPDPQDDGDLAPKTAPEPSEEPAAPVTPPAPKASPRAKPAPAQVAQAPQVSFRGQLETLMTQNEISYDQFSRWADGVGIIANCTSYPSFSEIPEADAKRVVVANKNGSVVTECKAMMGE